MGNGDPVTQKQFYETVNGNQKETLDAIGKVGDTVQNLRVDVKEVSTKQEAYETQVGKLEKSVDNQKTWNRGLAAVEGLLVAMLAAVGINRGQ